MMHVTIGVTVSVFAARGSWRIGKQFEAGFENCGKPPIELQQSMSRRHAQGMRGNAQVEAT